MKRILEPGIVVGGKLTLDSKERFSEGLSQFNGVRVLVEVRRETRNRKQNALLWVLNTAVGKELGWDAEDVHSHSKDNLLRVSKMKPDRETGELIEVTFTGNTHSLAVDAFADYMDRYIRFWSEQGYDPVHLAEKWQ